MNPSQKVEAQMDLKILAVSRRWSIPAMRKMITRVVISVLLV
jgi:hypothetical protein